MLEIERLVEARDYVLAQANVAETDAERAVLMEEVEGLNAEITPVLFRLLTAA